MDTVQIFGFIMATICGICGTILAIVAILNKQNCRYEAEQAERKRRQDAWNKTFENQALLLYEQERSKREELETKLLITQHQLKRAREQMAKVKLNAQM